MKNLSKQEIFDKVSKHLLTQNAKACLLGGCAYRDKENRKCAFGIFIPDDKYDPCVEGGTLAVVYPSRERDIDEPRNKILRAVLAEEIGIQNSEDPRFELLIRLQNIHDTVDVQDWRSSLQSLAYCYGLNQNATREIYS